MRLSAQGKIWMPWNTPDPTDASQNRPGCVCVKHRRAALLPCPGDDAGRPSERPRGAWSVGWESFPRAV